MKHIEISQITNGFVVELFDKHGPAKLDKIMFCKNWKEITTLITEWCEEQDNAIELKKEE